MRSLEITETTNTPHILFDVKNNNFLIEGKSFPEDSKEFYNQVIAWVDEYKSTKPKSFTINFNLFYLSSSSIIAVKQLLMKIVDMQANGTQASVVWNYDEDDDDIKKTGEDYEKLTKLKFDFRTN